jgi:hypothetical protein
MSKLTAFILCLTLCGCEAEPKSNRVQFKEYNCEHGIPLSIVAVDSIEFLVNTKTGYMIRITKGGDK